MRITRSAGGGLDASGFLSDAVLENIKKVFQVALGASLLLFGYLMWGLFSGAFADVVKEAATAQHAVQLVGQLSMWLNLCLVVTLLSSILLYYEEDSLGIVLVLVSAFLAYGLEFCITMLFASDAQRLTSGTASQNVLKEVHLAAMMIGAPGVLMILRSMIARFTTARQGEDLTNMQYGANVAREEVPKAMIGAFAKCWQLPFCRSGIRKSCPIFQAKTKCWKERVGCMCEENIILLAMGGTEQQKPVNMTKEMGFVPIGDLLSKGNEEKRAAITTRVGPRGVRIPTNPHITDQQKRERCRNCIIYNEHQRQKYQFFSAPVTLSIPVLVAWQFDSLTRLINMLMKAIDSLFSHLSISGNGPSLDLYKSVAGSMPIETMLIVCMTLILMTWAQRLLEYCTFKIKI